MTLLFSRIFGLFALLILLGCSACSSVQYRQLVTVAPDRPTLAFTNVSVFDGTSDSHRTGLDVIVTSGRISAIQPTGQALPKNARIIDGKGKFLLPGFVDSHVHVTGEAALPGQDLPADPEFVLRAHLFAGVTTVLDLGGLASDTRALREKVTAGEIPGPRIFLTHAPITAPGGHPVAAAKSLLPWPMSWLVGKLLPQVATVEEAAEAVDDTVDAGVDYIKVIADQIPPGVPELDLARLTALVKRAHDKWQLKVFAHVGSPKNAMDAVKAGADVLAHAVWHGALTDAQVAAIAASKVPMIATLWGWELTADIAEGKYQPAPMDKLIMPASAYAPLVSGAAGKAMLAHEVLGPFARQVAAGRKDRWTNLRKLHKAGVPLWVGTDSPLPGCYPGGAFHRELELLVKVGMTNAEVLRAATAAPARFLGKKATFGTIEVGKSADLALLRCDPLGDIACTRQLDAVVADGRWVSRQ